MPPPARPGYADVIASEIFVIAFDRRTRYDLAQPDAGPWLYHRGGRAAQQQRTPPLALERTSLRSGAGRSPGTRTRRAPARDRRSSRSCIRG
jgi:RNA polymerase sigma-70 factor (ECF subfamily)